MSGSHFAEGGALFYTNSTKGRHKDGQFVFLQYHKTLLDVKSYRVYTIFTSPGIYGVETLVVGQCKCGLRFANPPAVGSLDRLAIKQKAKARIERVFVVRLFSLFFTFF